jgi:hypothetical protein
MHRSSYTQEEYSTHHLVAKPLLFHWRQYRLLSLERDSAKNMAKRFLVMLVGAGMGSLSGLLISAMGAGNAGLIGGAVVGALLPLFVLGPPGPQAGK